MPDSEPLPLGGPDSWWADRGSCFTAGPRPREANRLAQGHWGSQVLALGVFPSSTRLPPTTRGTAGTYQVPGGSHQLVGGEREGLVAQVCVEHLLENGPAGSETELSVSHSASPPWAPCSVPGTGDAAVSGTNPCPHGAG